MDAEEKKTKGSQTIYFTVPGIWPGHQSRCCGEFSSSLLVDVNKAHWGHTWWQLPTVPESIMAINGALLANIYTMKRKDILSLGRYTVKCGHILPPAGTISASDTYHDYLGRVKNYNW